MMDLLELPQCRTRVMRALAVDADGTSLLASRFVSPLPLPPVLRLAAAAPTALPGISATESVMLKVSQSRYTPCSVWCSWLQRHPAKLAAVAQHCDSIYPTTSDDIPFGHRLISGSKSVCHCCVTDALWGTTCNPHLLRLIPKTFEPSDLPSNTHPAHTLSQIARFVSMVPYLEDSALQKRRVDVWCTAADTLHMAAGDGEEHAHLLAGYFMEIGQQAFVVMGASTYGARSMFVLTTGNTIGDPAQMVSHCSGQAPLLQV